MFVKVMRSIHKREFAFLNTTNESPKNQIKKTTQEFNKRNIRIIHWKLWTIAKKKSWINWEPFHVHRLEDEILLKGNSLQINRFSAIPIKIQAVFVAEIDKLILSYMWKFKEP